MNNIEENRTWFFFIKLGVAMSISGSTIIFQEIKKLPVAAEMKSIY